MGSFGEPGAQEGGTAVLMGSFCSRPCPDTTPAYTSASRGRPKGPETWSMAWPTTPKWTTAATATQPWCYSREVTLGPCPTAGLRRVPPAPQGVPARGASPQLPPIGCVREHPGDGRPLEAVEVLGPNVLRLLTEKQDSKGDARGVKVLTLPFWLCDLGASYLTSMSLIFSSVK